MSTLVGSYTDIMDIFLHGNTNDPEFQSMGAVFDDVCIEICYYVLCTAAH